MNSCNLARVTHHRSSNPSSIDLTELVEALSPGALTTDASVIASYSKDYSLYSPVGTAIALVRANSVDDVQATMRFAYAHNIPVVPQGARTGISGGANAIDGAILLSVAKMNRILEINPTDTCVTVEPGIINQELKDALRPMGLYYPPDPGSVRISSIGGNIATNAGGLCCVKYGVTRDFVREIKVVLADGTLTRLGRKTVKGVAGLDLCGLFVGSEGTLGVIVEATLSLIPLPAAPVTAVATFPNETAAATAVREFMAQGYRPSLMELMDGMTLTMLNEFGDFGLEDSAGAMLIMQSDSSTAVEDVRKFEEVARENGALDAVHSDDPRDSEDLVAARRSVQPAYETYSRAHGGGQLLDDVCVPRTQLPAFFRLLDDIRENTSVTVSMVAHAGDGNLHPAVFFDASDAESTAEAERIFGAIMQLGLDLGGTITGEHGVGSLKKAWLPRELDEGNRRLHRSVKDAIDPTGILNPEKMLADI